MSNEITPTQASALVPEVWGPVLIEALYEPLSFAPHILNRTADVKGPGDIVHIATEPTYSVNDMGSDGSLTAQQVSLGDVSLTINKNKEVTVEWTGITSAQTYRDWYDSFPRDAGNALRQQIDSDALALVRPNITQTQGDGTSDVGEDELTAGLQTMLTSKLPLFDKPDEFVFAFHASQFAAMRKLGLLDYQRTGEAGAGGAATARIPYLYGIPVVFTNQVETSSSIRYNVLCHKTAFAWAVQRNVVFEEASGLAGRKKTRVLNMWALYGVITVLAARAVALKSR